MCWVRWVFRIRNGKNVRGRRRSLPSASSSFPGFRSVRPTHLTTPLLQGPPTPDTAAPVTPAPVAVPPDTPAPVAPVVRNPLESLSAKMQDVRVDRGKSDVLLCWKHGFRRRPACARETQGCQSRARLGVVLEEIGTRSYLVGHDPVPLSPPFPPRRRLRRPQWMLRRRLRQHRPW